MTEDDVIRQTIADGLKAPQPIFREAVGWIRTDVVQNVFSEVFNVFRERVWPADRTPSRMEMEMFLDSIKHRIFEKSGQIAPAPEPLRPSDATPESESTLLASQSDYLAHKNRSRRRMED